ncbi:MAG: hypothetical protein IIB77_00315 [Proteobacteria bacterium]|nr:hypothetical protein [Pseudomonadota bacterium]
MDKNESSTLSDKLFDLCEMQLLSIISDAEVSMSNVMGSTSAVVQASAKLSEIIDDLQLKSKNGADLCSSLEESVNGIMINIQFFDELSQRIEHIMKIIDLIRLESNREGFLSDPEASEKLFRRIKAIFSIRSEFEVMRNIFPEYDEIKSIKAVEIF